MKFASWKISSWLLAIAALLNAPARAEAPAKPSGKSTAKRPNILLIYSDDQSYKTMGSYPGSFPWVKTPNMDALAKSGVRFSYAYLGSWCMPSRAMLLTGKYPHGVESMRMVGKYPGGEYDPKQCPFWPAQLRQHGYQTAQIGKWHTGNDAGYGRDWDYQIVWNRPKHPDNAGAYYTKQMLAFNGEEREVDGYSTDNYTKWACDYIRGDHRSQDKPWYLWLCYGAVHGPSTPAPRHKGQFANEKVPTPADIFPPRPDKPAYLDKTQSWTKGPNGEPVAGKSGEAFGDESAKNAKTHANFVRQVNECILALDEGIGKVLAALKESGQLENTLVIFTADQGFSMGEHGFRTKLAPYDANFRSPLVISQPGTIPQGKVCDHPVSGCDLVRTMAAASGLTIPWKTHGHDLTPLLKDPAAPWPYPCLFEHTGHDYGSDTQRVMAEDPKHAIHNEVPWWVAIRQGKWKYIRKLAAGEMEELYYMQADPEELTNLAVKDDYRSQVAELREVCNAELRRTDAGMVDHFPPTKLMKAEGKKK